MWRIQCGNFEIQEYRSDNYRNALINRGRSLFDRFGDMTDIPRAFRKMIVKFVNGLVVNRMTQSASSPEAKEGSVSDRSVEISKLLERNPFCIFSFYLLQLPVTF